MWLPLNQSLASTSKSFNASELQPSGLSSTSMAGRGRHDDDQALDEDSAAGLSKIQSQDKEIDADLDDISAAVSRLQTIAGAMNEEVSSCQMLTASC